MALQNVNFEEMTFYDFERNFEPKYKDYEMDCSGMGILSVSNFIEEIEKRNNDTILTVNCSDGSAYHTLFDKESWEEFKDSKNSIGTAITKVWVTEEFNKTKNEKAFYEKREEYWENKYKNENVQYMKSENGEVYGFTFDGEIYIDEDLVNSNVLAHEYTHIWDNYVQKNNPELWQKGMTCLKGTSLWYEITEDKNYENLRTDDEILSECHARIVGKMAEQVLERIAARDGELTKDKIIDWDKEVNEYVATELLIKPELGDENYISESVKAEYLKEFLSMPMKDLMNELKVQMGKRQEINIQQDIRQEKKALIEKIKSWATDENFDIAEGLSREDIFEKFGNDREIIAILPNEILPLFDVTDKNVYCGKGYFIDHMANHHPEVDLSYYESIQNILDEHKEIYLDTKNGSVVFGQTNVFGKKDFLALRKDNDDKIVFYKTFYYGNKIPKKFQKI